MNGANKIFSSVLSTVIAAAIIGAAGCLWNLNGKFAELRQDIALIKARLGIAAIDASQSAPAFPSGLQYEQSAVTAWTARKSSPPQLPDPKGSL